jgi:hypothetical protein
MAPGSRGKRPQNGRRHAPRQGNSSSESPRSDDSTTRSKTSEQQVDETGGSDESDKSEDASQSAQSDGVDDTMSVLTGPSEAIRDSSTEDKHKQACVNYANHAVQQMGRTSDKQVTALCVANIKNHVFRLRKFADPRKMKAEEEKGLLQMVMQGVNVSKEKTHELWPSIKREVVATLRHKRHTCISSMRKTIVGEWERTLAGQTK